MNRDDIIRIVREVADKDKVEPIYNGMVTLTLDEVSRLLAAEREACAKLLENTDLSGLNGDPKLQHWIATLLSSYAAAIRARGQS